GEGARRDRVNFDDLLVAELHDGAFAVGLFQAIHRELEGFQPGFAFFVSIHGLEGLGVKNMCLNRIDRSNIRTFYDEFLVTPEIFFECLAVRGLGNETAPPPKGTRPISSSACRRTFFWVWPV